MSTTRYHGANIDQQKNFYREVDPADATVLLLLPGFPISSHLDRYLIPILANRYRVTAPDLPGFGFSAAPDNALFEYTFESLTNVVDQFTETLGLDHYAIFMFNFSTPVILRWKQILQKSQTRFVNFSLEFCPSQTRHWQPVILKH